MDERHVAIGKLNMQELLERTEHDRELVRELISLFLEEFPRRLEQVSAAVRCADWPQVMVVSHALKGMLSNLAVPVAASLAGELERAARSGNVASVNDAFRAFRREIEGLLPEVQAQMVEAPRANLDRG